MLVLTRKMQQQIRIGDNIVITIVRVQGQSVRVGIDAPRSVRVVRSELPDLPNPAAAPRKMTTVASPAAGEDAQGASFGSVFSKNDRGAAPAWPAASPRAYSLAERVALRCVATGRESSDGSSAEGRHPLPLARFLAAR